MTSMSDVRRTKVLCHKDGELFCNYGPDPKKYGYIHAVYMCDEATPPAPETLDLIIQPGGVTDVKDLVWYEIEARVRPVMPPWETVAGEFDYEFGNFVPAVNLKPEEE